MNKYLLLFILLISAAPAFAQTSNTTTSNTTTSGTTNASVTSPGNVVVSTPNGTIGNQVNTPANTNNVYVVTPGANGNNIGNGQNYNNLTPRQRDEIDQRRAERAYNDAQGQHDYRDRANYYNIRRNERVESDNGGSTSQLTRRNYQADYHSNYNTNSNSGYQHRSNR